jgi:hypothetical protein
MFEVGFSWTLENILNLRMTSIIFIQLFKLFDDIGIILYDLKDLVHTSFIFDSLNLQLESTQGPNNV